MMTLAWFPMFGPLGTVGELTETAFAGPRGGEFDIDREETADAFLFRIPVSGMRKRDLEVELRDGVVFVRGERTRGPLSTRTACSLVRCFSLPPAADAAAVRADYEHGVLLVRAPKRDDARPRRIPIRVQDVHDVAATVAEATSAPGRSGFAAWWAKAAGAARSALGLTGREEVKS